MRSLLCTAILTALSLATAGHVAVAADAADLTLRPQPYKVLLKAAMILPETDTPVVTAPEAELFEDAADGHIEHFKLADVALISDGVTDSKIRKQYLTKIAAITEEARKAIASGKTPEEKADLLVHHLFKGPLHGGFTNCQVDFRRLLDEGKFNCVSSSLLYNLVAGRLGLKTYCITLPNHVFLRMGDLVIEPVDGYTCTKQ